MVMQTFLDQIANFKERLGQEYLKPTSLYEEFNVEIAKRVCMGRSKWEEVIFAYFNGTRA
jgi:hypothetical protein